MNSVVHLSTILAYMRYMYVVWYINNISIVIRRKIGPIYKYIWSSGNDTYPPTQMIILCVYVGSKTW